ncbi:MAG: hypothetical protein O9341_07890, partial [Paucibacter sp.]|nr:hypothetical protein [Roseateles sp.]
MQKQQQQQEKMQHLQHQGSCHCGAVRLTLPNTPAPATSCNGSRGRGVGGPWVYFEWGAVKIEPAPGALPQQA